MKVFYLQRNRTRVQRKGKSQSLKMSYIFYIWEGKAEKESAENLSWKKNEEKINNFLNNFDDKVTKAIYEKEEELWVTIDYDKILLATEDEWRFGRIGTVKSCWVPKIQRALVPKHDMREFVYMYTAVIPQTWKHVSLIMPYANMDCMNRFMEELSNQYKDNIIVLQIDWARFHVGWKIKVPPNIIIIQQPPYSPETNPTEQIRAEWREKFFANSIYKSLDYVESRLVEYCEYLDSNPDIIRSMCRYPHLRNSRYSSV
jgi:hypothetical protein